MDSDNSRWFVLRFSVRPAADFGHDCYKSQISRLETLERWGLALKLSPENWWKCEPEVLMWRSVRGDTWAAASGTESVF